MRSTILALAAAAALSGCATGDLVRDLRPGMTEAQVVDTLGRPDGLQRQGGTEVMTYSNRLMSGTSHDRADYKVVLVDGRVTQYGATAVRPHQPNMMLLMGLPGLPR